MYHFIFLENVNVTIRAATIKRKLGGSYSHNWFIFSVILMRLYIKKIAASSFLNQKDLLPFFNIYKINEVSRFFSKKISPFYRLSD